MAHAHHLNAANPGTFNEELQKLFKANNLPTINIPTDPPSKDILNLTNQGTTQPLINDLCTSTTLTQTSIPQTRPQLTTIPTQPAPTNIAATQHKVPSTGSKAHETNTQSTEDK